MEENRNETVVNEPETIQEPLVRPSKVLFKTMKVVGCESLNVRKAPFPNADIQSELQKGSLVNVNMEKSTPDYYYVASETSDPEHKIPIHGFCKKDFLIE